MQSDKGHEYTDLECALFSVDYPANGALYGIERHAAIIRDAYFSMKAERDKYKAIAYEREEALKGLKYYIDNPSAWEHFSQNVSNAIQDSVAVVDDECMVRALALREKES